MNGAIKPEFANLVAESYAEVSPSGQGLRVLLSGTTARDPKNHAAGFEVFHSKGFVTLTGKKWPTSPERIRALNAAPFAQKAIREYANAPSGLQNTPPGAVDTQGALLREIDRQQALASIDSAVLEDVTAAIAVLPDELADGHDDWIRIGMALKSLDAEYPEESCALWHQFSARSGKYAFEEAQQRWEGFAPNSISFRSIFAIADEVSRSWRKPIGGLVHNSSIWEPIDYDPASPVATDWLIKGIIPTGLGVFAGQPGAGKTSSLLPLALLVAGFDLPRTNLEIKFPRKVIMVTEAPQQATLMLYAFCRECDLDPELVRRKITIIPGRRATIDQISTLAPLIEALTVEQDCPIGRVKLAPWTIFDTQNSSFDLEDENSNSEVGRLIGAIRTHLVQGLKAPVAIVCHASKTTDRASENAMARGASAFAGDAEFTATLMQHSSGARFLHLNKVRFQPSARLIAFDCLDVVSEIPDNYGGTEKTEVKISIPRKTSEEEIRGIDREVREREKLEQDDTALAAFDRWVRSSQGDKTAIIQTTSGSPTLPAGMIPENTFRIGSDKLKEFRLSAASHSERFQAEYGWTTSGSYLTLSPKFKTSPPF